MSVPARKDSDYFKRCGQRGEILNVALWYPRQDGEPNCVEVELIDVRAADSIRVRYDFERDGWSVLQEREAEPNGEPTDDWAEVAFVKAWGRPASVSTAALGEVAAIAVDGEHQRLAESIPNNSPGA